MYCRYCAIAYKGNKKPDVTDSLNTINRMQTHGMRGKILKICYFYLSFLQRTYYGFGFEAGSGIKI